MKKLLLKGKTKILERWWVKVKLNFWKFITESESENIVSEIESGTMISEMESDSEKIIHERKSELSWTTMIERERAVGDYCAVH